MKRVLASTILSAFAFVVCVASFGQSGSNPPTPPTKSHAVVHKKTVHKPKHELEAEPNVSTTTPTVTLSWSAPTSGVTPTSYNIYRSTTSNSFGTTPIGSSSTPSYIDPTVGYSTTYFYVVTSVNATIPTGTCPSGKTCESGWSNQATAVIPANSSPNPPTGLTSTVVVSLNWTPPTESVSSYLVYRRLSTVPTYTVIASGLTQPNFVDASLSPGTYYYKVRALVTQNGKQVYSGWSNLDMIVVE